MDRSKKNQGVVAALPDDPLLEILSRVPAKSVCRFKCVSKAWRDLIADPHHRKKLPQAMQGLFLPVLERRMDSRSFGFTFNFIDLTARSVPLDIDPAFSFLTKWPGFKDLSLKDSCNGLILFDHEERPELGYVVCNPTTKRWAAVPPTCGSPDLATWVYLAFEPAISSHFHLVQFNVSTDDVYWEYELLVSLHVYSSETGTWSGNRIGSQENEGPLAEWLHYTMPPHGDHPEYAFVNGFLHFIVWDWDSDLLQILVVDVQGKARRLITGPSVADGNQYWSYHLAQSQGCLHYMTKEILEHELDYKLSIWVLQDYDTEAEEWVLKKTVNSLEIFGELTHELPKFQIVGIHQDCNVVFFWQSRHKLIAYDMDRNEVSVISTFKDQKMSILFARYVPCFSELPALTN